MYTLYKYIINIYFFDGTKFKYGFIIFVWVKTIILFKYKLDGGTFINTRTV
jgi:hypothetical protein